MDGPFPKLCLTVALSHQDGRHSAAALLLKAALIQVSDYRLLSASGLLPLQYVLSTNPLIFVGQGMDCFGLVVVYVHLSWLLFFIEIPNGFLCKLSSLSRPFWSEGGPTSPNLRRGPSNDYFFKVWFQLSNWLQTRRCLCEFPIGPMLN